MTLFCKVAILLAGSMALGGLGCYLGRNITSLRSFIALAIVFIFGTIGVIGGAHVSPVLGVILLAGWTLVSGLVMGPAIRHYTKTLGWQTVANAYVGTAAVMTGCGLVGALSGADFSGLESILLVLLLGLIFTSLTAVTISLSRQGRIVQSIVGMFTFSGYFLVDFWRLSKSENTWEAAIELTMSIYLDFMNFFLYLLQLLEELNK